MDIEKLVGMSEEEAKKLALDNGFKFRCMLRVIDGKSIPMVGTMDFRKDRINYHVEDEVITKVYIG